MEVVIGIIFAIVFAGMMFIRKVPPHTVIIVDRNTHYLKTKKSGFYWFNPSTDKVTTRISKYKLSRIYTNHFEAHDGNIYKITFSVTYHAENLDDVLAGLSSVRRSIDDVMNGSVYWAVNDLSRADMSNSYQLKSETMPKLLSEAQELKIIIDSFYINQIYQVSSNQNIVPFKPHLSSHSQGPIQFH